jgi:hypothetical protein
MMEWLVAGKLLGKALAAGVAGYEAWTTVGFDTKELAAIPAVIDLLGELGGKASKRSPEMEALHLEIITRCFGQAFGRHWKFNSALAPKLKGLRVFMTKQERKRAEEIELRMGLALQELKELASPGDRPAAQEWSQVASLAGGPLSTPYYRALWTAFTNPKLDDENLKEPPLLDLGEAGRLEFERHFLLAYHQALTSSVGQPLQSYLPSLMGDYRTRLLRELLLKDMAGWSERHIFGNIERHERADEDPIPFMPLGQMYVEPDAGVSGEDKDTRAPALERIEHLLREPRKNVLVVKADFGMGKSLTARTLAQRWAQRFLEGRAPSPQLPLPVYIRCAEDLPDDGFSLEQTVRSAWKRQADDLGLELKASDEALSLPGKEQQTVFLFDGLDEVVLGERRLESFFKSIREEATKHHRFIVFSRPGALPAEQALKDIPLLELLPWRREQSEAWLGCWRGLHGGEGPTYAQLKERELTELVGTPILLFMVAQTWRQHSTEAGTSRAALYEEFFAQIAKGKHEVAQEHHQNVAEASSRLREQLIRLGLLARDAEDPDAMLWLMGRVAWEATKLEQRQMLEPQRKAQVLTKRDIANLFVEELEVAQNASDTIGAIQAGLLLTMQAHLRADEASQILFGHKSFREYLVARYWADRLKALVRTRERDWNSIERPLLGGRLLSREDRTFDFLMEMLNGGALPRRPHAPFGLTDVERSALLRWAQDCFESEEPSFLPRSQQSLREDRKPWLREAALAIGSSLHGSPGLNQKDKLTLRSMLAWFWLMRIPPFIVAPKGHFKDASMSDLTLRDADFRGADLEGANFSRDILTPGHIAEGSRPTDFSGANLDRAILRATLESVQFRGCSMREADLTQANLRRADMREARLVGASLQFADLRGTVFDGADLTDAKVMHANLRDASLVGAVLTRANFLDSHLQGANLQGTNLEGVTLAGAEYDRRTQWPAGFDPEAAGARLDQRTRDREARRPAAREE